MEEDILRAVGRIAGRQYRECYRDLCAMVEAAIPCMPGTFALEDLYPAVQAAAGRPREVLAKSVSRAAEDRNAIISALKDDFKRITLDLQGRQG